MFEEISFLAKSSFSSTSIFLAYLFLFIIPVVIYKFFKLWSSVKSRSIKIIWSVLAVFYLGVLFLVFPGFVGIDDVYLSIDTGRGTASSWHSLTYSFFAAIGDHLFGGFGFTTAVCILFFLYIALKIFALIADSELSKKRKLLAALSLFILALHPINQSILLFYCRDTLFSLFLFYLGFQTMEKYDWTPFKVVWFVVLLVLLGDLRQEAKVYLIVFPLVFYFLKKWDTSHLKIYLIASIVLGYCYYNPIQKYFYTDAYSRRYIGTVYVMPLSQIFHDKPLNQISDEYKKNISAVLDIEKLKMYFNPIGIEAYYHGAFNRNATAEQWIKFKDSAHSLILENLDIFFKNRIYLFKSMLNLGQAPFFFNDYLRTPGALDLLNAKTGVMVKDRPKAMGDLGKAYQEALRQGVYNSNLFTCLVSSFLLPISFLILCLFSIRYYAAVGCFALIISIRLPILFLLAPANYVKYIYSVFLFFTFVPVIFYLSYMRSKNISKKSSN